MLAKGFMVSNTLIARDIDEEDDRKKNIAYIRQKEAEHKKFTSCEESFISPISGNDFKIKLHKNAQFFLNNKVCKAEDLHSREISFEYWLRRFDFINEQGARIVGISIVVTKIVA